MGSATTPEISGSRPQVPVNRPMVPVTRPMVPVTLQHIHRKFDQQVALQDLSLEIRTGELFFLLGPSGCGKTTCLRIIAGFTPPDSGRLLFGQRDMTKVPPYRRNTGMVFQNYALWPHMTVSANVEYGLKVRKIKREERQRRLQTVLEMVRLEGLGQRYPGQLSGGQQQRVALARALVIEPDVLLLDEPLSNLDAALRLEMRQDIARLQRATGVTAVYVTHDQEEALSIADRIAVLKDGELQQVGTPRELYQAPASRFVAVFLGETNLLPGVVSRADATSAEVQTAMGSLQSASPGTALQPGRQVWCSIRPEALRPVTDATGTASGVNLLRGRLEHIAFLGSSEQYTVTLNRSDAPVQDSEHLTPAAPQVKVRSRPQHVTLQPGMPLELTCQPADVVVLTA